MTFANLCSATQLTTVLSGAAADDAMATLAATALGEHCGESLMTRSVSLSDSAVSDPTTGEPLTGGGEILLLLGGPNSHRVGRYVEEAGVAPFYFEIAEGQYRYVSRTTSEVVAGTSVLDDTHDLLLIELMRSERGSLVVYGYGGRGAGTSATGWFFANVMFPALGDYDQAWYVYEWSDLGNVGPDASDTFALRAQGI
jgi:hypothetical protein